jgi:hypothetical protein
LWFLTILSLKNGTQGKSKIPLDTNPILGYFPAIVTHHSFLPNNLTSNFWGIYALDFPEDAQAIGSKGILNILWSLSSLPFLNCPFFI